MTKIWNQILCTGNCFNNVFLKLKLIKISAFEVAKCSTSSDKNDEDLESDFMLSSLLSYFFFEVLLFSHQLILTFFNKNDEDLGSDFMHSNKSLFS